MGRGPEHPEGRRPFALEHIHAFPHQVCPTCGARSEWWTWWRHQGDGSRYLSVGLPVGGALPAVRPYEHRLRRPDTRVGRSLGRVRPVHDRVAGASPHEAQQPAPRVRRRAPGHHGHHGHSATCHGPVDHAPVGSGTTGRAATGYSRQTVAPGRVGTAQHSRSHARGGLRPRPGEAAGSRRGEHLERSCVAGTGGLNGDGTVRLAQHRAPCTDEHRAGRHHAGVAVSTTTGPGVTA